MESNHHPLVFQTSATDHISYQAILKCPSGFEPPTIPWQGTMLPLHYGHITRREKHVYVRLELTTSRLKILTHYHCANKRFLQLLQNSSKKIGRPGIEPEYPEPQSGVLPLNYRPHITAVRVGFEPTGLAPQKISSLRSYDHLSTSPYGTPAGSRTQITKLTIHFLFPNDDLGKEQLNYCLH